MAALDRAGDGARVNALAPGEEVAAAPWLCSEAAGFIIGSTLRIDGGKLAGTPPFLTKPEPG